MITMDPKRLIWCRCLELPATDTAAEQLMLDHSGQVHCISQQTNLICKTFCLKHWVSASKMRCAGDGMTCYLADMRYLEAGSAHYSIDLKHNPTKRFSGGSVGFQKRHVENMGNKYLPAKQ